MLDVAQAQTALFSAQASEAQDMRQIAQDMEEIVLLERCPDIRAAADMLLAANASIGAARAEFRE
jgi:outer membrane protein TolC